MKGVEAQVRAQEGLLSGVLGRFGIPEDAPREAEDRPAMTEHEYVERSSITGLSAPHQLVVHHREIHSHVCLLVLASVRRSPASADASARSGYTPIAPHRRGAVTAPDGLRLHR